MNSKTREQLAWFRLAGIGALVLTLVDGVVDYLFKTNASMGLLILNVALALVATVFGSFFIYAFVVLGNIYKKQFATTAWLQMILAIVVTVIGNLEIYGGKEFAFLSMIVLAATAVKGVLLVVFGFQMKSMVEQLGNLAKLTGILNIVTGILFISVVLAPVAVLFDLVVTLYSLALISRIASDKPQTQTS